MREGGLIAGPSNDPMAGKPLVIPGTENQFRIASATFDWKMNQCRRNIISASDTKSSSDCDFAGSAKDRLSQIRLGTSDHSSKKDVANFCGQIAEILLYNTALERDVRHHVENYLRRKHFGRNGNTVVLK